MGARYPNTDYVEAGELVAHAVELQAFFRHKAGQMASISNRTKVEENPCLPGIGLSGHARRAGSALPSSVALGLDRSQGDVEGRPADGRIQRQERLLSHCRARCDDHCLGIALICGRLTRPGLDHSRPKTTGNDAGLSVLRGNLGMTLSHRGTENCGALLFAACAWEFSNLVSAAGSGCPIFPSAPGFWRIGLVAPSARCNLTFRKHLYFSAHAH